MWGLVAPGVFAKCPFPDPSTQNARQLGICHRDIKPQNLLLDPNSHVVKVSVAAVRGRGRAKMGGAAGGALNPERTPKP